MMAALSILLFVACVIVVIHIMEHGDSRGTFGAILNIYRGRAQSKPVSKFRGKHLSQEDRQGFLRAWQSIRRQFECDPKTAIVYADLLVSDLLGLGSRSQDRLAKRALAHTAIDDRYQAAHAITKSENVRFLSSAELERAMHIYASLFDHVVLGSGRGRSDLEGRMLKEKQQDPSLSCVTQEHTS